MQSYVKEFERILKVVLFLRMMAKKSYAIGQNMIRVFEIYYCFTLFLGNQYMSIIFFITLSLHTLMYDLSIPTSLSNSLLFSLSVQGLPRYPGINEKVTKPNQKRCFYSNRSRWWRSLSCNGTSPVSNCLTLSWSLPLLGENSSAYSWQSCSVRWY